ncbi:hypothetical protein ACWDY4_25925 [Streptomyces olivaceoviridis]
MPHETQQSLENDGYRAQLAVFAGGRVLLRSRPFTPEEEAQLTVLSVLDTVSGIAYGTAHDDPELVERGLRTLARLRTAQRP